MREYELAVIYDLELAEAEGPEASVQRVKNAVEAAGGTVKDLDHWGRRRMAYPINKAIDGDFIISRIEIDPAAVSSIEATLKIDERAYRTLVVRADELFEITPMQDRRDREPRPYAGRPAEGAAPPPAADAAAPSGDAPTAPADAAVTPPAEVPTAEAPAAETPAEAPAAAVETPVAEAPAPEAPAETTPAVEAPDEAEAEEKTED